MLATQFIKNGELDNLKSVKENDRGTSTHKSDNTNSLEIAVNTANDKGENSAIIVGKNKHFAKRNNANKKGYQENDRHF